MTIEDIRRMLEGNEEMLLPSKPPVPENPAGMTFAQWQAYAARMMADKEKRGS